MLREIQERIHKNKLQKGFPIGNVYFDISKIKEELRELKEAYDKANFENLGEELADILIMTIGIGSYFQIDIQSELLKKLDKIEKRKIKTIGKNKFIKEEG